MLVDSTLKQFLDKVAANEPIPGGGSVAALNGAIAASLTAMVANLTIGKKGYEELGNLMKQYVETANRTKEEFLLDVDRDSDAYNQVFACFKMPKDTDEEKAARSAAIQEATKHAAIVPMKVARLAYQLIGVITEVAKKGNQNAITDACVAMMSARSAVLGALMNVRINLSSLKDKELVKKLSHEADQLEQLTNMKEKDLLDKVNEELRQ